MHTCQRFFCAFSSFFFLRKHIIYFERDTEHKGAALTKFTLCLNASTHFFQQCFHDRHTKPGAFVKGSRIIFFLCKWLEKMISDKLFTHSYSGIHNLEFIPYSCAVTGKLLCIRINTSVWFVVLDRITQKIQHDTAQLQGTSTQCGMLNVFSVSVMCDSRFNQLCIYQCSNLIHQFTHIKSIFFNFKHTCFQLAHIQYIAYQFQQMFRRKPDLFEAVINLFPVIAVFADDIHHTHDTIDRSADIMTHTVHKFRFCFVFSICFFKRYLQTLFFLLLLLVEI